MALNRGGWGDRRRERQMQLDVGGRGQIEADSHEEEVVVWGDRCVKVDVHSTKFSHCKVEFLGR